MAGQLTIDTLKASSGVLATQNGMTGIAKAWVNFNGVTTTTISNSFNVSSVTRNSTGSYTINFTTTMANANYVPSICVGNNVGTVTGVISSAGSSSSPTLKSTTQLQIFTSTTSGTLLDDAEINLIIMGS